MPKIAEIEYTPNPNAKRFVLKEPLTLGVARSFDSAAQADADPLAKELFTVPHVTSVYYIDKYLTVTQDGRASWPDLERQLAVPIRAAETTAVQGAGVQAAVATMEPANEADRERLKAINALIDERVRPALMMDGGGLELVALEGNTLKIHYQGACGSCPSALAGTMAGIEGLLPTIEPNIQLVAV
jgi:Fe-S cluster biogenesis protein NfuA